MVKWNLLFVFSDQQSFDTLGAYGNQEIQTPNLDRLAARSVVVDYGFANNPVCTPSRAMLLSGRNTWRAGAHENDQALRPEAGPHLAEVLNGQGYRSAWIGKWHLYSERNRPIPPGPFRYGFDDRFLSNNCTVSFQPEDTFYWNEAGEKVPLHQYEPDGQTDQAIAYIREQAERKGPWNLFVSWHPPHNPHEHCPQEWSDRYDPATLTLRPGMPDTPVNRKRTAQYYGMISNLDWNFGRLLNALEETGQLENTLIVYTSDHGDTLLLPDKSWHERSYKRRPEDLSLRVPMLFALPGRTEARRLATPVSILDLMPTLLGLLGAPLPEDLDGENLAPLIRGEAGERERVIPIWNEEMKWRGVATGRYTYSTGSIRRLYDRKQDPDQMQNRVGDPAYTEIQSELHQATLDWRRRFGDDLDLTTVPVTDRSEHPYHLVPPEPRRKTKNISESTSAEMYPKPQER